jgi:hypothetical protein
MCVSHILLLYTDTRSLLLEVGAQPLAADHGVDLSCCPFPGLSLSGGGEVMRYHITLHSCRLRGSRDRDKIEVPLVRLRNGGSKVLRHSLSRLSPLRHGVSACMRGWHRTSLRLGRAFFFDCRQAWGTFG